jgi:uncharacterized damage-inducible protein DinB
MPTHAPLVILLTHNAWANRQLLEACGKLTEDQFHKPFEMGPGSLHDTVTHIIGTMRAWGDMLAGREQRDRLEGEKRSVHELQALHDQVDADLQLAAKEGELDTTVTGERGGRTYTFMRGAVLTHVTTHGMHHRAQCVNMLRQLGADIPLNSVIEWMLTVDGQG